VFVTVSLGGAPAAHADDPTPPTVPGVPTFSQVTEFSVTLTWAPSVDNIGVSNYLIARTLPIGGSWNESTPGNVTTITIRNLTPNNLYTFAITAVDPGGNVSAPTAPASVRTLRYTAGSMCSVSYQQISGGSGSFFSQVAMTNLTPPTEFTINDQPCVVAGETRPPSPPGNLTASNVTPGSVSLTWTAATPGTNPIRFYEVLVNGFIYTCVGVNPLSCLVSGPSPGTFYAFSVSAVDTTGLVGAATTITLQTPSSTPPSAPANLTATGISSTSATLTWTPSTPGSAPLAGYVIYRIDPAGDVAIAVTPGATTTSTTVTGLAPSTIYQMRVRARDTLGVLSGPSPLVGFLTPAPQGDCAVTYTASDWGDGSGFTANVTITNTGTSTIAGWALRFSFAAGTGQRVGQGWNANWTQALGSAEVNATNLDWNATIPPGASVGIGFNGSFSGSNPKPDAFRLNGHPCNVS
jgi:hypothetical protein